MSTQDKIRAVVAAFARGDKPGPPGGGRTTNGPIYFAGDSWRTYVRGDRGKTCSTDGEKIYSYDEPIVVKLHDRDNTVLVLNRWRTPAVSTTDRHIYVCKSDLPGHGFRVEVVDDLRGAVRERRDRRRYASTRPHGLCERAEHCLEHEQDRNVSSCKGDR